MLFKWNTNFPGIMPAELNSVYIFICYHFNFIVYRIQMKKPSFDYQWGRLDCLTSPSTEAHRIAQETQKIRWRRT